MNAYIQTVIDNLKKRGYRATYCQGKENLTDLIMREIFADGVLSATTVGFGHSHTLEAIGLYETLKGKSAQVWHHDPPHTSSDEDRAALQSDVYFLSANALTKDGTIVNIDGTGNRVAASVFGPKRVVFVIGRNKIVDTLDEAIDRAVNVSIKLSKMRPQAASLPCTREGRCVECFSPGCPCGVLAIHRKNLFGRDTTVILVDKEMGL